MLLCVIKKHDKIGNIIVIILSYSSEKKMLLSTDEFFYPLFAQINYMGRQQ